MKIEIVLEYPEKLLGKLSYWTYIFHLVSEDALKNKKSGRFENLFYKHLFDTLSLMLVLTFGVLNIICNRIFKIDWFERNDL
ncbi:MAG TPA: hypothetical protein VHE53_00105 [Patescibacteria group bacterium]|nr:hypothetical protein [Patescibacteria group bacterium]